MVKVPYTPGSNRKADVNRPATWGTFAAACAGAATMSGIGMVLTDGDPYTGIDIDDKPENPASDEERERHRSILDTFQSYTERSVGGRGYHIVIRGKIDGGRDRGHVGIYSTARYLTFTGDVVRNAPIAECQDLLDSMASLMTPTATVDLVDAESTLSDDQVIARATRASNGEKFSNLCAGDWQLMGYPSQSEADYALLSLLAFYTPDNEQARRLFRATELGKRAKATQNNTYLDRMLKKLRAKEPSAASNSETMASVHLLVQNLLANGVHGLGPTRAPCPPPPMRLVPAAPLPTSPIEPIPLLRPPEGLLRDLYDYFHATARYQMEEGAILAALGLMAGVAGRQYNFDGSGLNLYLLLLARSGRGKEAMRSGISRLVSAVQRKGYGEVLMVLGPDEFASGQGLMRTLQSQQSFLSIQGEFGHRMKSLNDPRAPESTRFLRRAYLDLYNKSDKNVLMMPTAYSDSTKNTIPIQAPCVSILAESTPGPVYDNLSYSDVLDGFLSRLLILEVDDDRPDTNSMAGAAPGEALVQRFALLVRACIDMRVALQPRFAEVEVHPTAAQKLADFQRQADRDFRDKDLDELEQTLKNRMALGMKRVAALSAVGRDPQQPVITLDDLEWAQSFVQYALNGVTQKVRDGMVGGGGTRHEGEVRKFIRDYQFLTPIKRRSYKVPVRLSDDSRCVGLAYLRRRANRVAAFTQDRRGMEHALTDTLTAMCRSGALIKLTGTQTKSRYGIDSDVYEVGQEF